MTRKRRRFLVRRYAMSVKGSRDPAYVRRQYLRLLAAFYKEDGNLKFFAVARTKARRNGAKIDTELVTGQITRKEAFRRIRRECADEYAGVLKRFGIADVDIRSRPYRRLTRRLAFQVLQAFMDVDPNDKSAVCISMAKTWHQFVKELHRIYSLPTVTALRAATQAESEAEQFVLDSNNFETTITPRQRKILAWYVQ